MIRAILYFILFMVLYQAVRSIVRSALAAYRNDGGPRRVPGQEMVQDPHCRTYIVKDRAVARRDGGATAYFCSEACADAHGKGRRP